MAKTQFLKDMDSSFHKRTSKILVSRLSKEYKRLEEEISEIERFLKDTLPGDRDENGGKINHYSDCCARMETIAMKIYYRQGFQDGIAYIIESQAKSKK